MRFTGITAAIALLATAVSALDKPLDIQVDKAVECSRKTIAGECHSTPRWFLTQRPPSLAGNTRDKNTSTNISTGDKIAVHYRGTLASTGSEFDASYNRGQPLTFHVGKGQVIKGWDQGLLDMCPGEKRTLTIQPEWGYGDRGMGPIPAGSTLSTL